MRGLVVSALCCACSAPHAGDADAGVADGSVLLDAQPDSARDATAQCQHAGDLDPSFGKGGMIPRMFGRTVSAVSDVVIDADQRILLAGASGPTLADGKLALVRLLADGNYDPSFGMHGKALTGVPGYNCWLEGIALQSDGKIVGTGGCNSEAAHLGLFVVARFLPNGALDASFGSGGIVLGQPPFRGHGVAIEVDAQGRLVLAGQRSLDPDDIETDFVTARLLPDGTLDATFATGGVALQPFAKHRDFATDLALQPDGRILVVGPNGMFGWRFGIVRYNDDGSPDATYGSNGRVIITPGGGWGIPTGIALDANGRALVAGETGGPGYGVVRLQTNGEPDPTFASAGTLMTNYGATKLAVDPQSQRIYITGNSAQPHFDLTRLTPDGAVDPTFGANGTASAASGEQSTFASALAIDAEGRIVVVATSVSLNAPAQPVMEDFFVARFCP